MKKRQNRVSQFYMKFKWSKLVVAIVLAITVALLVLTLMFQLSEKTARIETPCPSGYEDTLVVVADKDYYPSSYVDENGNPSGFEVELIYKIANEMKMNVDMHMESWSQAKKDLSSGEADIILGLEYQPENLPQYLLTMPFQNDKFVVFSKKEVETIDNLRNGTIATIRGSGSYEEYIKAQGLESHTVLFDSYSEAIEAVEKGQCDYAISRKMIGDSVIAQRGYTDIFQSDLEIIDELMCMGVSKENDRLVDVLNAKIIEAFKDDTLRDLYKRWKGVGVRQTFKDFLGSHASEALISVLILSCMVIAYISVINRKKIISALSQRDELSKVVQYQQLIAEATEVLYESIYEIDITRDRPANQATEEYFESFGVPKGSPYSTAITTIAKERIKPGFEAGYREHLMPDKINEAFHNNQTRIEYAFPIAQDGYHYFWYRLIARLFYWEEDNSIRMIIYSQNIEEEKRREQALLEQSQRDAMTNLYNKTFTESTIDTFMRTENCQNGRHCFIILDIDNFKNINDTYGHQFGDIVIKELSKKLQECFRQDDIIGRIGGDEFAAFIPYVSDKEWVQAKVMEVLHVLSGHYQVEDESIYVSISIGVAITPNGGTDFKTLYRNADSALYIAKDGGKHSFRIYEPRE